MENRRGELKRMKELSTAEKTLENKTEQYYTDCRTKEGTKQ